MKDKVEFFFKKKWLRYIFGFLSSFNSTIYIYDESTFFTLTWLISLNSKGNSLNLDFFQILSIFIMILLRERNIKGQKH